jgi:hypothetical protein
MSVAGSRMYPNCYNSNCDAWGVGKVVDGGEKRWTSLGLTSLGTNPYMQLDLGSLRSDIQQVRLVSRATVGYLAQSQNVSVHLSSTTDFLGAGSTQCDSNVTFESSGDDAIVLCPANFTARYVTVMKKGTDYLSLQEVQPMYDGEYWAAGCYGHCCQHRVAMRYWRAWRGAATPTLPTIRNSDGTAACSPGPAACTLSSAPAGAAFLVIVS